MDKNGGWRRGKAAFLNQLWQCTWKDAAITFGVLFIATAAAFVYYRISASNINVVMFYTLALLFISRLTSGYLPGIAAAMVSVVCVNYLFHLSLFAAEFYAGRIPGYLYLYACGLCDNQRIRIPYEAAVQDSGRA